MWVRVHICRLETIVKEAIVISKFMTSVLPISTSLSVASLANNYWAGVSEPHSNGRGTLVSLFLL